MSLKIILSKLTSCFDKTMAHHDTVENLLKKLNPNEISAVRRNMINRLIRMKSLKSFRLWDKYYMVAIDGTGHLVFKDRHCPHCLTKQKDGKITY